MNNKILFLFLFGIFFINLISAESLGTFKQSQDVRVTQTCDDATYIILSSITYPNYSLSVYNITMTDSGNGEFFYIFNKTSENGRYDIRGISDGCEKIFTTFFYIGEPLTTGIAIFYGVIILLLLLVLILSINKIFTAIKISGFLLFIALSYFILLILNFTLWQLSETYLSDLDWLVLLFKMSSLLILILMLPLIIGLFIYLLFRMVSERRVNSLLEMGYSPDEAHKMSRR